MLMVHSAAITAPVCFLVWWEWCCGSDRLNVLGYSALV
jgi:hypothetical protein